MVTPLPALDAIRGFIDPRRATLLGLASGLAQGNDWGEGMGLGFARAAQGRVQDDAYATAKKEEAERAKQLNYTIQAFQKAGRQDLVDMANAGMMGEAWNAFNQRTEPTAAQRDFQFAQENPEFGEFLNPSKPADKPAAIREYEYAVGQGFQGTFAEYEQQMRKAGATSIDFNATQGRSAAYADRMAAADAVLSDPKLEAAQTDIVQQGMGNIPVAGNFITSEEKKLADQAQRDFINAVLRRESGAVISPSEFENARQQYFPQPGDTDAVKEQKKRNRKLATAGIMREAGPSYEAPAAIGGDDVVDYVTYFGG
jgi:hypothetical protein